MLGADEDEQDFTPGPAGAVGRSTRMSERSERNASAATSVLVLGASAHEVEVEVGNHE